jgi:hypothetical protein
VGASPRLRREFARVIPGDELRFGHGRACYTLVYSRNPTDEDGALAQAVPAWSVFCRPNLGLLVSPLCSCNCGR